VTDELVQYFTLVGETPLNDTSVLEAAKYRLFGEAGRNNLIPDLGLLFFLLCLE